MVMLSRLGCIILISALMLQNGCSSYKSPVPVDLPIEEMDDYTKGLLDGEKDAHGYKGWMYVGCLWSILGGILAWNYEPTPPVHTLKDKSQDYVRGYTEGYQNKSRAKNTEYALRGCGCTAGIMALLLYFLSTSNISM